MLPSSSLSCLSLPSYSSHSSPPPTPPLLLSSLPPTPLPSFLSLQSAIDAMKCFLSSGWSVAFNVVDRYISGVVATAEFHVLHHTEDSRWAGCTGWESTMVQ